MFKWLIRNKKNENLQSVSLPNLHSSSKNSNQCHKALPNKNDFYGAPASTSVEQIKRSDSTLKLFEKMSKYQSVLQTELFEELSAIEGRSYFSPKLNVRHSLSISEDVENLDLQPIAKEKRRRRHSSPVVPSYFYNQTQFISSNKEEAREKDLSILQKTKLSDVKVYDEADDHSCKVRNHVDVDCYNRNNVNVFKCTCKHNKTDAVKDNKYNDQKSEKGGEHGGDGGDDNDDDNDDDDDYDDYGDDDDGYEEEEDDDDDDDKEDLFKEVHDSDITRIIPRKGEEIFHKELSKSFVYKSRRTSSPGLLGIKLSNEQKINSSLPQIVIENDDSNYS